MICFKYLILLQILNQIFVVFALYDIYLKAIGVEISQEDE